jgi:glycosyltransferase involved in cell wall biosynthesis
MIDAIGPLVTVVIPTYNHARFLGDALRSVLDQTFTDWEAIVIDNHSQDNTDDVVASFADPRIKLLKIQNNGVIAASRNMGVRAAKGEWIAFLDSDDRWTPNKLHVSIKHVNNMIDLIYHDLEIVGEVPGFFQRKRVKSRRVKSPVAIDLLVNGNAIANSSVVVRKILLDKIGGINESSKIIAAEDYNTWLRIGQITEKFFYIHEVLGYYMQHDQGVSRKDMSVPAKYACAEFLHLLKDRQKQKLESNLRFTGGQFAFVSGNYMTARKELLFCLLHGDFSMKLKSVFIFLATLKKLNNI